MLQCRLKGMTLALVDFSVRAWQRKVVLFEKLTEDTCVVGALLGRLVLPHSFIARLGQRNLQVGISQKKQWCMGLGSLGKGFL